MRYFNLSSLLPLLVTQSVVVLGGSTQDGEEARWLVQSAKWATLSWMENESVQSIVTSIAADPQGRIFMYLMEDLIFNGSLTISEAQLDPKQFAGAKCGPDGEWDPEDPRCGKLTISGVVSPCTDEENKQLALDTLYATHPEMADWPPEHGFIPVEMDIDESDGLWMIANYGGGGYMKKADYFDSDPVRHPAQGFGGDRRRTLQQDMPYDVLEEESTSTSTTTTTTAATTTTTSPAAFACYNMQTHDCECVNEKCGENLCGAAGGIWTDQCQVECSCVATEAQEVVSQESESNSQEEPQGMHEHGEGHEGHDHGSYSGHGEGGDHGSWSGGSGEGHYGGDHDHSGHGESGEGHYGGDHGSWSGGSGEGHYGGDHDHSGHDHDHSGHGGETHHPDTPTILPRPDFGDDSIAHARWLVAKSLWTTISTISSKNSGYPFGNIRSISDGPCFMSSTGLPYFYVPAPDPTALDIQANNLISLSFTEAALAERVSESGVPCGGNDAESPICAKITLMGKAVPITDDAQIETAKMSFATQHPRASWLASGGGHTGGSYYTLELENIMFLRNFGGFATVSAEEYVNWKPDPQSSMFTGEYQCGGGGMSGHDHDHGGMSGHDHGGHGGMGEQYSSNSYGSQAQANFVEVDSKTSMSFSAIMIVLFVSFIGSFFGSLWSERYKRRGRRVPVYDHASVIEGSRNPKTEMTDAEVC